MAIPVVATGHTDHTLMAGFSGGARTGESVTPGNRVAFEARSTASAKTGIPGGTRERWDGSYAPSYAYDTASETSGVAGAGEVMDETEETTGVAPTLVDVSAKAGRKILETIAGIPAYTPAEQIRLGQMRDFIRRNYERFGFSQFTPDPVVASAALGMKGGLEHETYGVFRIRNAEATGFALPFDRTVPLALFVARNHTQMAYPYARYDIKDSWRAEAATAGRYRAFEQCDVDFINTKPITPEQEADCLAAMIQSLEDIGITDFTLCINHLTISKALLANIGIPEDQIPAILRIVDKAEKVGIDQTCADIMGAVPGLEEAKVRTMLEQIRAPIALDSLCIEGLTGDDVIGALEHLRRLIAHLQAQGIDISKIQIRPSMVRGLDYYTGFVFETFMNGHENRGSIASGGAYDNLVGTYNPKAQNVCGCGGSIGLTRLFSVMKEMGLMDGLKRKVTHDITVILQDAGASALHSQTTGELRRLGYRVAQLVLEDGNLQKQIGVVNKQGCPYAVIVKADGQLSLKHMNAAERTQTDHATLAQLVEKVATLGLTKV